MKNYAKTTYFIPKSHLLWDLVHILVILYNILSKNGFEFVHNNIYITISLFYNQIIRADVTIAAVAGCMWMRRAEAAETDNLQLYYGGKRQ